MKVQTKEIIKAVKGFNADMTCTPIKDIKFQYEEGKTYEEKMLMYVAKDSMLANFRLMFSDTIHQLKVSITR